MGNRTVKTEHYDHYDVPLFGKGHNAGDYATVTDHDTGTSIRMWSGKSEADAISKAIKEVNRIDGKK